MLLKCTECGKEISHTAGKCPGCGCKKPFSGIQLMNKDIKDWKFSDKNSFLQSGGKIKLDFSLLKKLLLTILIGFVTLVIIAMIGNSNKSPEENAARDKRIVEQKIENQKQKAQDDGKKVGQEKERKQLEKLTDTANAQKPGPPQWDKSKQTYGEYVKAIGAYNDQVRKQNAEGGKEQEKHREEWYQGGSLHASTLKEWSVASTKNKLATASDWIVIVLGEDQVRNMELLKLKSNILVNCVDTLIPVISESYDIAETETRSTALICITQLEANGWQ